MQQNLLENLNEEQKKAVICKNGPLLIIAGAGTGKTTVITGRIAWLILSNQIKPEEILALTFTDKAAEEMKERVDKILPYGYVDLWISTFHSFAERILKQHAIDIGLPDNFKLLNQTEQNFLIRRNFDRFNLDYYRPLGNPTKFIQAMIKHFSRAKDEEIWPEDYLKYAKEIEQNIDNMLSGGQKCQISNVKCQKNKKLNSKLDDEITNNQGNLNYTMAGQEIARINEIANAYHIYQQLLLENSALDFGDLINYTLKLFRERPQILEKYQKQFKYILIDEFQDTNWAQYELIKLLGAPKNNITVSFDDDQSIYKFRGASISNVLQFKKDYPKAQQIVLIKNYRSKQNILDLAYNFIQLNNPNRLEWQLQKF